MKTLDHRKLTKICAQFGDSTKAGLAAVHANKMVREAGLTWEDVIKEPLAKPTYRKFSFFKTLCALFFALTSLALVVFCVLALFLLVMSIVTFAMWEFQNGAYLLARAVFSGVCGASLLLVAGFFYRTGKLYEK